MNEVQQMRFLGGSTDTAAALSLTGEMFTEEKGARPEVAAPFVIIFTDGYSATDPRPGYNYAQLLALRKIASPKTWVDGKTVSRKVEHCNKVGSGWQYTVQATSQKMYYGNFNAKFDTKFHL